MDVCGGRKISSTWREPLSQLDQAHRSWDLLDRITASLYQLGLSLQTATGLPADAARRATADALQHLDDTLREILEETFPDCD